MKNTTNNCLPTRLLTFVPSQKKSPVCKRRDANDSTDASFSLHQKNTRTKWPLFKSNNWLRYKELILY